MTKCDKKGHRFEARYNYGEPRIKSMGESSNITAQELVNIINSTKSKTYIHDICVKCGKIVNKEVE